MFQFLIHRSYHIFRSLFTGSTSTTTSFKTPSREPRFDPNPRRKDIEIRGWFRDEPQGRGQNIVFHSVSSLSNEQSQAGREDWILHGYRSDCATSFRQSRRRNRSAASPPPVSMRESPGFARRGGDINPSLNDALSPPFIKRSFRRLQVAGCASINGIPRRRGGGGRSCE